MFAVVRHPDIEAVGVVPRSAFELNRAKGFYRVSEWRETPSDFHLPDYANGVDLDAEPEPEPDPEPEVAEKPAESKKESD
jgi:hypothetical protein